MENEELQTEETVQEETTATESEENVTAPETDTDTAEESGTVRKKDLKKALEEKDQELATQKDQYLRLMAEYQNYRNRTTEEKKKLYNDAKADAVKQLLNVIDTLERALAVPCADEDYRKGVEMTFTQLQKAFADMGVVAIDPLGEAFDPNLHSAINQIDNSEFESDTVCQVFQKGYMLGDRLIRPAMVAVAL